MFICQVIYVINRLMTVSRVPSIGFSGVCWFTFRPVIYTFVTLEMLTCAPGNVIIVDTETEGTVNWSCFNSVDQVDTPG